MKVKKKKLIKKIILVAIIVVALLLSFNLSNQEIPGENKLKDALLSINKLLVKTTYNQIIDQTESYTIQRNMNLSLEKEIKELKELLELNSTHSLYEKIHATVINRNNLYWLNTLTIDKGTSHGITKGMAVITKNGLIGKISNVTNKTSEVKLLTSADLTNKTSVIIKVDGKDNYAILDGYDDKNNLLKVTAVDKNINTTTGTEIITSGLGTMPQGIYIGKIVSSETDSYELSKTIYVKSDQDFFNINYVTVLKENN